MIDSNVWISAIRFGGQPLAVLDAAFTNHTIAICDAIKNEVARNLLEKFDVPLPFTKTIIDRYLERGLRIKVPGSLRKVCRDQSDDIIIECATLAEASYIITGDKDLLTLGAFANVKMTSPSDWLMLVTATS